LTRDFRQGDGYGEANIGKSVAVLGAGLVGGQEREVIGTLEISNRGDEEPDAWVLWWLHYPDYLVENLPAYLRRYYLGDFEELMRALRELEIGV
jgi:hypothetical protein